MVEEAKHEVVRRIGDVEIRRYAPMVMASVAGLSDYEAFGILFRYITGGNRSREEIAMTSPVVSSSRGSEEIAMTAPVVSDEGSFAFVLPSSYNMQSAPIPLDSRARLVEVGPRLVAVIRFRGRAWSRQVARKTGILMAVLDKNNMRAKGKPFLMRYNPPYTPGFMRRNELGVEIEE